MGFALIFVAFVAFVPEREPWALFGYRASSFRPASSASKLRMVLNTMK